MNNEKCRFCGYVGPIVCDGIGPRMGCDMPGKQPGYQPPSDALIRAEINGDSPVMPFVSELQTLVP
ncbi:hypothetical protein [Paraburkholderia sp. HD33-4]|uniref:hypothetical protein n=1 Tax=Paraburkholderia sp. HD33-4 TaxID=2883242 RepID=UPI001F355D08|nr:hypothetical protein [Paraburkholderia sp. HD33-4]